MGKTGDTKKRIYEMLEQKNKTLTDISDELGLAPSTVSQHLQEMLDSGAIRLVEDRPRKWKYYEINRGYPISKGYMQANNSQRGFDFRKVAIPIAVIAIALVSVFAFYMVNSSAYATAQQVYLAPGSSVPVGSTVFSISDAPSFYNISALTVTVNNASIRSKSTGKWFNIPLQAKTFDLVKLNNISSLLSGVKLSSGVYDNLVLHISNVTATINGTKQPVILPSGRLFITGNFNISNSTTNWVNLDFDLAHSLHITSNGEIIMMPVINIKHANENELEVSESSAIVARYPGKPRESMEFGMDQNGSMMRNFSTPQNLSINAGPGGRLEVGGPGDIPIIIRSKHSLVIGGDAASLINATGFGTNSNFTSNANAETAYRKCLGISATAINGTATNEDVILRRCCIGIVRPLVNGNLSANSTAWMGNTTMVSTSPGILPPALSCCYLINVVSPKGKISIRRCLPVGVAPNVSNGIREYPDVWNNSSISEELNISMPNGHGNFSASCTLQNGALSCNPGGFGMPPGDIVAGIGQHVTKGIQDNAGTNPVIINHNAT